MTAQPTPGEVLNGEEWEIEVTGPRETRFVLIDTVRNREIIKIPTEGPVCFEGDGPDIEIAARVFAKMIPNSTEETPAAVLRILQALVSRPQPSGGQDGGGEAKHFAAFMVDPGVIHAASPAKATGWPSWEAIRQRIAEIVEAAIERHAPTNSVRHTLDDADAILALFPTTPIKAETHE